MKYIILFGLMFSIVGCWDIQEELPNGYKYISEQGSIEYQYIIYEKATSLIKQENNAIPCKILDYKFNKKYILAKIKFHYDMDCAVGFEESKILIEGKIYYYIIDTQKNVRYGAYKDKRDFDNKIKELKIELKL